MRQVLDFLVRLAVSAAVLWAAVAWASPGNPANTFARALAVSVVLSVAYYVTLARFLWFLLVPWLVYVLVWFAVIGASYGLGFFRSLVLAIVLSVLSWLVGAVLGIRTFRSG